MAEITSNLLGQLSGRVGSLIFSKNGSGQYVKGYVVGTDAKSLAQISSRNRFSVMASHWRLLSQAQKNSWKVYARTLFVSKHPKPSAVYSGYESFVSLNTILATCNSSNYDGLLIDPPCTVLYDAFPSVNYTAPSFSFSSQIQSYFGESISLILNTASYDTSSRVVTFNLLMCPAVQADPVVFKTPLSNLSLGFACYFSMPFSGGRTTVNSKEAYLIGTVLPPTITSGWVTSNSLTFSWIIPSDYFSKCKYAFLPSHHIFFTVYAVGLTGESKMIGRLLVTLT
jgi:hypothetical protein